MAKVAGPISNITGSIPTATGYIANVTSSMAKISGSMAQAARSIPKVSGSIVKALEYPSMFCAFSLNFRSSSAHAP